MLKGFKGNIDTCSQKQKEYMSAQACVHDPLALLLSALTNSCLARSAIK